MSRSKERKAPVVVGSDLRAAKIDLELARIRLRAEARDYADASEEDFDSASDDLERAAIAFTEALAELRRREA